MKLNPIILDTVDENRWYQEGYNAYCLDKLPLKCNPYSSETEAHSIWNEGYIDACEAE